MLVITSPEAAVARGGERAVGSMVICVGTDAVVVFVDAKGLPTYAPHMCPDCTVHGIDAATMDVLDSGAVPIWPHHVVAAGLLYLCIVPQRHDAARGPPVLI